MTKFRWHAGGLKESMETVIEVSSFEELHKIISKRICKCWENIGLPCTIEIKIIPYGYDNRIGWDTYLVSERIVEANEKFCAIGFTNGPL